MAGVLLDCYVITVLRIYPPPSPSYGSDPVTRI
jgi:hypothetical protein